MLLDSGEAVARKELKRKRAADDNHEADLMKKLDTLAAEKLGLIQKIETMESEVNEVSSYFSSKNHLNLCKI